MSDGIDIEIDWNLADRTPTASIAPTAPVAPPTPSAPSTNGGWDRGVSDASAALVERERELAREHGFAHDDEELAYAPGTQLADVGLAASDAHAAEYAALPSIADAATAHASAIAAEQRRDCVVTLSDWRVDASGRLAHQTEAKQTASLSDTAWWQLQSAHVGSAPRGNVNAWLGGTTGSVKARVRTLGTERQIFAIVSNSRRGYTAYDSEAALHDLARAIPDTRCSVEYDAATTRLKARAYVQAPVDVPAFVGVGRVHRAGVQFTTRDDGTASLAGRAFIERIRCKNHTLVEEKQGEIRRRHVGTYEQLRSQIRTLVGRMPALIEGLKALWSRAAAEFYLDSESGARLSACEAIARLVVAGYLPMGGLSEADAIAAYQAAWRAEESPQSAAGVIMAVQRAAHEVAWKTKWADDEIEESASALLYQRVHTLDAPQVDA